MDYIGTDYMVGFIYGAILAGLVGAVALALAKRYKK
jgi:hypothetical protein